MSEEIMETVEQAETETAAVETQEKTFTQDELDRIVADRVAREQRKFDKKLQGGNREESKELSQKREESEREAQKQRC
mgnify:CR=1 FL=1